MRKIIFKLLLFFISITNSKGQFILEPDLSYPLVVSATKSGWIYYNATLLSDKQKSYSKNEKINVISDHNLLWLRTESGGFIEKSNVVYKSPERLENERLQNERLQIERNVRIENQRIENEKQAIAQRIENERQAIAQRIENEKLLNEKIQKIKINSNFLKWTKGDKICNQIKNGVLMGVIDDWNENKSKVKLKIIAGPEGNYEAEPIVQGSYIWASTVGKGWHLCLDDEIEKAVENNQSLNNKVASNDNKASKGEISFEMKGIAAKYAKLAGKQISYKCKNYSVPSNLNAEIGEIKYFEEGGGGFMVDIVYQWNDKDMTNRNVLEMYKGKITFDQYGCNGLFIISSKTNGGGFFSTGKQGACFTAIPENKKEMYRQLEPNASWFINVECLE